MGQTTQVQITSTALPLAGVSQTYMTQLTATGAPGPYSWSLVLPDVSNPQNPLPPGVTMNDVGLISGLPTAAGIYLFQVRVFAANQSTATATLRIIVIRVETESPLPEGQTGVGYSQPLAVTAGNPTWSLVGGQLPNGLTVDPAGLIRGTPLTAGVFTFFVRATVPNLPGTPAVTAQKQMELTVIAGPLTITTQALPDGTVGADYSEKIEAGGGTPPYTITVAPSSLPPGLAFIGNQLLTGKPTVAGGYTLQVQAADSAGGTATRAIPLAILGAGGAGLTVAPLSLRFTAFEGAGSTPPQDLVISSISGTPMTFSAVVAGAPVAPPAWLSITNPGSTTPAIARIRANPAGFTAGVLETLIRITAGNQPVITVPVTFNVLAAAPKLEVSPKILGTTSRVANPRADFTLSLRNTGGGATVDYDISVAGNSRWITRVASAPGRLAPNQPVAIRLSIDASGLRTGAYRDELRIRSSIGQLTVPVSLFVEDSGPVLSLAARGVRLTARQGDPATAQRTILVRNRGTAGTTVNWSASILRGADVFTLSPAQGSATPGSPSALTIGLKPNAADTPGGKVALLRIADSRAQGSPDYVVLVADVAPAAAAAPSELAPAGLTFLAIAGGTNPAPQTIQYRTTARSLTFTAAASTTDGAPWLSVTPASGTASASAPATLQIAAAGTGLPAGVYTGLVTVAAGAQVRAARVTLIVLPAGARLSEAGPKPAAAPRLAEGCTPARVTISQTALSESFSVPAGWPATITAKLIDDCGTSLANGAVIASFSNGDAPIVLEGDGLGGDYSATWQPGAAAASATVTLEAAAGTLQPATLEITGGIEANPVNPPSLVTAGLLNNLNPIVGAPLAPGTVTQVYGDNLTENPDAPSTVPLPIQYKGVEALIGGLSAPIYYISKNQLTVQVPSELTANQIHSALLVSNTGYSLPVPVPLVPVQPGTVQFPNGALVAQHADYSLVTANNPARPGEIVAIYLVGMGATSPPVASGTAAPSAPPATVNTGASVTVDGQAADIAFQGLTPGGVGLYQINFRVPANARAGSLDIVITQDGVPANATRLIVAP